MIVYWILTLPRFVAYTSFVSDSIGQGSKQCKMGNGSNDDFPYSSYLFYYFYLFGASRGK